MYATVFHVESYAGGRAPFTASTKPSATQVVDLLLDATSEVERDLVKAGYALPVPPTASSSFRLVQAACAKCAWAAVEAAAPNADDKRRELAQEMCESARKMIQDGELPDYEQDTMQSSPRSGYYPTAYFGREMEL